MRQYSANEFETLTLPQRSTHVRTYLQGTGLKSILGERDFFHSGQLSCSLDQPVWRATLRYALGQGYLGTGISPFLTSGLLPINIDTCFDAGKNISLATYVAQPGAAVAPEDVFGPDLWHFVFRGVIDDVDVDPDRDLLVVQARCIVSRTLDRKIDILTTTPTGWNYGFVVTGGTLDQVLRQIYERMDQPSGNFAVLGTPTFAVADFWQSGENGNLGTLEAMRRWGLQNGWDLRGRWDIDTSAGGFGPDSYQLTYYQPDRFLTGEPLFFNQGSQSVPGTPSYFKITKLGRSRGPVRNRCDVIPATTARVPQRAEDFVSQGSYGVQFNGLAEDRSSGIDTDQEAIDLATINIQDLSQPPTTLAFEGPYFWLAELGDLFALGANGVNYDLNQNYAITSITHDFLPGGETKTTISGSTSAAAANSEWRRGLPRRVHVSLSEPSGPGPQGAIWLQVDDLTLP